MRSLNNVESIPRPPNFDPSPSPSSPYGQVAETVQERPEHALSVSYPKGALICLEGNPASGVFILLSGRVKESLSCSDGKKVIVRISEPGQIVGLASVLSDGFYDMTAETLERAQVEFLPKKEFLDRLGTSEELARKVTKQLGQNCKDAYQNLRRFGFSVNVPQRIAALVLQWADQPAARMQNGASRFQITLTQEEVGQLVGTTRETVSRTLMNFRQKGWITIKGATWTIYNRNALVRMSEMGDLRAA